MSNTARNLLSISQVYSEFFEYHYPKIQQEIEVSQRFRIHQLMTGSEVYRETGYHYASFYDYADTYDTYEEKILLCTANKQAPDEYQVFSYPNGNRHFQGISPRENLEWAMSLAGRYTLAAWIVKKGESMLYAARSGFTEVASLRTRAVSSQTRREVFERDGYVCAYCGSTEDLQIDHIYPWSKGGTHDLNNLQVLCRPCNIHKGARVEGAKP